MQLSSYVQAVVEDLRRIAAVGDEQTARTAELLTVALESSVTRRLQEALAEAALELSSQLSTGRVEVRVAGEDPELVYVEDAQLAQAEASDEAFAARITLRLPESLKGRLEAAAASAGVSLNTWLVQTLGRALESRSTHGGGRHRLSGYGRS
jgi:predicted HicB family RNase H-like nuclease